MIWYDELLQSASLYSGAKTKNLQDKENNIKRTPISTRLSTKKTNQLFEGRAVKQKNGLKATIVRYGGYKDVDIQFEDGVIITKQCLDN
ncbi:MAG: hypothetical protein J6N53_14340 [Lachnospiraceae bacterium]|nr:hypothetical protein [Lachnospiraceae bacterium]